MKNIHFSVPNEVYSEFHKLFPMRGDKAHFLRNVIVSAIRHADKKDFFALVTMGKEKIREQLD